MCWRGQLSEFANVEITLRSPRRHTAITIQPAGHYESGTVQLVIVIGTGNFIVDERQSEEVEHRELVENTQEFLRAVMAEQIPDALLTAAWSEFYRVYDVLVRRFAVARGVRGAYVEDCVQDVWSEIAKRLVGFRITSEAGLRSWLFALARTVVGENVATLPGCGGGLTRSRAKSTWTIAPCTDPGVIENGPVSNGAFAARVFSATSSAAS